MITGRTRVLVVLADPIEHVQAPRLLNARIEARCLDAVLVPMHVHPRGLPAAIAALRAMENCLGGVVTMPHKATIAGLLDELSPDATAVGAVNAFVRRGAQLSGDNLDGRGFIDGLASEGLSCVGKHVYLAGAGGAAAAIALAVAKQGAASLTLFNRTRSAAEQLAVRVRATSPLTVDVTDGGPGAHHDLVINATPLGRSPDDPLPLDPSVLSAGAICADILMGPDRTRFLQIAASKGCRVHRGEPMLEAQLDRMLALWFDETPRVP